MPLYHIIDEKTNIVVYADKIIDGKLEDVIDANKGFIVVESKSGAAGAPRIIPGFLLHKGEFWSPVRHSRAISDGTAMPVSSDDFYRLFTQDELENLYDFEDNPEISEKEKKEIRVFLKRVEVSAGITLSSPMIVKALKTIIKNSIITKERELEIVSSTFMQ